MANSIPTRATLLVRLRDTKDQQSWAEFTEIYTPLLYHYCQRREIPSSDIADIVQEVMSSISRAMSDFHYDPERGHFRGWLFTVLKNSIRKHYRKANRSPIPVSDEELAHIGDEQVTSDEQDQWNHDYHRQLIAWALEKIRPEFSEHIFRAFVATTIEELKPAEVAEETGMTTNAIAVAKYRVFKKLQTCIQAIDADEWEQEVIKRPDDS